MANYQVKCVESCTNTKGAFWVNNAIYTVNEQDLFNLAVDGLIDNFQVIDQLSSQDAELIAQGRTIHGSADDGLRNIISRIE